MPYNHRGTPIAPNHRSTPRVAQLVEKHLNNKIDEFQTNLIDENPLLNYTMAGQTTEVQPGNGQDILNRYRDLRDKTAEYRAHKGGPTRIEEEAGNIREALASRRKP